MRSIIVVLVLLPSVAWAGNDSAFVSQSMPSHMSPGSAYSVTVVLQNTGDTTWTSSGSNPYLLGSKSPQDNTTWGAAHISLGSSVTVAPGDNATYSFTVTAPTGPGTYTFQWQVFQQGIEYFGAWTVPVPIIVTSGAGNDSTFVSNSNMPAGIAPSGSRTVSVSFRNTGSTTWTGSGDYPFVLGSKSPHDNLNWGVNHIPLGSSTTVAPGDVATFTFAITAPAATGVYDYQWQVFQSGVEYFGSWSDAISVHVTNDIASGDCVDTHFGRDDVVNLDDGNSQFLCYGGQWYDCGWSTSDSWHTHKYQPQVVGDWACMTDDYSRWQSAANMAAFVSQTVPSVMAPGRAYTVSVTFENTGTTTWTDGSFPYRLGAQTPRDTTIWGENRVYLDSSEAIAPGYQKTFTFGVTAPTSPGTYAFSWEMIQEDVAWFGAYSTEVDVVVPSCTPTTCAQEGFACGIAWDSGCQMQMDCGACSAGVCQ